MQGNGMKILGVVLLVLCGVCVFVAVERYNDNANNVRAIDELQRSSPLGPIVGIEMKPATPAASKYAVLFAVLFAVAGAVLLVAAARKPQSRTGGGGQS